LWIQREITNPSTGHKELEALHRIPLKMLECVTFTDQTTDNHFRLKLYNATEDFVFRCEDAPNDALRWVQTLTKHEQLAKRTMDSGENKVHTESSNPFQQQQVPSTKGMPIRDLRATCHGAGVNTAGMERAQLEAAAEEVLQQGTYFNQQGMTQGVATAHVHRYHNDQNAQQYAPQQQQQQQQQQQYSQTSHANVESNQSKNAMPVPTGSTPLQQEQQQPQQRVGIKELRAICHGAGISTAGMERKELEAAAKEVESRGTYIDPPIGMHAANDDSARARQDIKMQQQQQQRNEEMRRRQEVEERHRREVEGARRRAAVAEEENRRRAAEEEARRRAAASEQLRHQREAQAAQTRYAQQQAAWQKQQQADEQRRRIAEQQATAEHRRREEEQRKAWEWANPAQGTHPQPHPPHQYHPQPRHQVYPQPQQPRNQNSPPPQQYYKQQPQNHAPPPPQQQQQQQRQHSGSDNKYAKMANQSDDDGQAAITKIKHSILIKWALQPPQLQMLRPIAALVTTIHTVFPPALGVSAHDYFTKWKPITREDVAGANGLPEETKLKKSVRKIRFFLHPDKLPHDLDEEQKFMVKMLWDITSDAWEEYQKNKEELDWVN